MKYKEHIENGIKVVEINDKNIIINNAQDFLDLISNLSSKHVVVYKENLTEDFFNLKTGIAGEILQKTSNYKINFGIIGSFSEYDSKSLKDFIYESNKTKQVIFYNTLNEILKVFCDSK